MKGQIKGQINKVSKQDLQTKGIIVREGGRKEGKWVIKVNKRN